MLRNHFVLDEANTGVRQTGDGVSGEVGILRLGHKIHLYFLDLLDGINIEQRDVFSRVLKNAHGLEFQLESIHLAGTWAVQVVHYVEQHHDAISVLLMNLAIEVLPEPLRAGVETGFTSKRKVLLVIAADWMPT